MKRSFTLIVMLCIIGMANWAIAQEVKINTDFTIEADGTFEVTNDARTWDDLRVPLSEPSTGTVKPVWAKFPYGFDGSGPYLNWFQPTGVDEMYFVVQLPHDWDEETNIMPHIHWVPSASGAAGPTTPRWVLQYAWANLGEAFPVYDTVSGNTTVPNEVLVKDKHYLTPLGSGGIPAAGKTISSMLVCRIYRDGGNSLDTYTGLAGALEVDFHYQRNTIGSRNQYTK